jgi:homoserine kinase
MSVANMGSGFDTFGLCLDRPADILEARPSERPRLRVDGDDSIPTDLRRNAASVAAKAFARELGVRWSVDLHLIKGCRGGSGIGSSGASAVAGAVAAAALLRADVQRPAVAAALLRSAFAGEAAGSGSAHLDNVAASLFGGFTIVESMHPQIVHRLPVPRGIRVVIGLPEYRLDTQRSRSVLPTHIPRRDAVENVAHAAAFIHGIMTGDVEAIGRNMVDRIAEPYRRRLVPGLDAAATAARRAGALGVALAGSGPSVVALTRVRRAPDVARALRRGFARGGVPAEALICRAGRGAQLLERT